MRKGFALLAILMLVAAGSAVARDASVPEMKQALLPGETMDGMFSQREFTRQDTLWFGGDDGSGNALLSAELGNPDDATWTWDHGGPDPLEGWYTIDVTENDMVYFRRVTAGFFSVDDPCTPMFPGEVGEIWCGATEQEADDRDWTDGMGYGNSWCQRAMTPELPFDGTNDIEISYKFFNDTEPLYDYSYVYVLCWDTDVVPQEQIAEIELIYYDGEWGSYDAPVTGSQTALAAEIPAETDVYQVEFRFSSDGGWSDEDGDYPTDCGPCAWDDISVTHGANNYDYDFETDDEGWMFEKCEGVGAFMAVWPEATWDEWVTTLEMPCGCTMSGNALGCVDETTTFPVPGHPVDQEEQMHSGLCVLDRETYPVESYNTTFVQWDAFQYLRRAAGTFYRPGYKYYPYTSVYNPNVHWSPRLGQDSWYHTGASPYCSDDSRYNLTQNGLIRDWEQMRYIHEFICSCASFGIPPQECRFEGQTFGAPMIDNVRIGVTGAVDAPAIALATGHLFHDQFGQNFPTYLEPGDVGNSNVSYDWTRDDYERVDFHSDSCMIEGPMPTAARQWLCNLMVYIEEKGPRQDMIPAYHFWKSRLTGDPEVDWVPILMDSAQNSAGTVTNQAFVTYFHEDDPGFIGTEDYNEINEALPDMAFTPGTTVRYYFAPYWTDTPGNPGFYGPDDGWEFQVLPMMRLVEGSDWDVEWPSVLYIDAYNRGSETYIEPTLEQLGLEWDKFDALDKGSNYDCPIKRQFLNGEWGNNGMTVQQLLGYRLVILNTGVFGIDSMEPVTWSLFDAWLDATDCPEAGAVRRGLVLNGDEIVALVDDAITGDPDFLNLKLGTDLVDPSYRDYNADQFDCIGLQETAANEFAPAAPGVSPWGNDCPSIFDYNVLGTFATGDVEPVGNLMWVALDYPTQGTDPTVNYAQIVRDMSDQPTTNWKTVVDGFSFHHLSEYGGVGDECSNDSARIVDGAANLLGPELEWISDVADPFVLWQYPCEDAGIEEETDGHLAGPVNFLYQSRPNPFRNSATIRFNMANAGDVHLAVFDVTGRLVRTLHDGELTAGEHSLVWDGADNNGSRVSGGIFWVQMSREGWTSSKKMIALR